LYSYSSISPTVSAQWEILNDGSDLKGPPSTIDFVNDVGWIAGSVSWYGYFCDVGFLLKTEDGGENWNSIEIDESWNIPMIDFISESNWLGNSK